MCIRDSAEATPAAAEPPDALEVAPAQEAIPTPVVTTPNPCLLYTSDAADERSSVDLGGRRIIKKKKSGHDHSRAQYRRQRMRDMYKKHK